MNVRKTKNFSQLASVLLSAVLATLVVGTWSFEGSDIKLQQPNQAYAQGRAKVIEDIRSKFRLLETKHGVLPVDYIQALEQSLSNIHDVDSLVGFSYALDDLVYAY